MNRYATGFCGFMQNQGIDMYLRTLAISVAAMMVSASAYAATQVATVDVQEVMTKSTAVQSINKQLESRRQGFQEQMSKKEDQLRNVDQELSKQRGVLSSEAFEKKKKEFRDDVARAQRDLQQKKGQLDKAAAKAMTEVQQSVQKIIEGMSKEKNFDMAIATGQLLWAKPEMDVTQAVIQRLNQSLPDVKVTMDSSTAAAKPK